MKYLIFIFPFFSCLFLNGQSPWTKKKGYFFTQFSYTQIPTYNTHFLRNGETYYIGRNLRDETIQFYSEYGLTDDITILAIVPYKIEHTFSANGKSTFPLTNENEIESGRLYGVGNASAGVKVALPTKKVNSSYMFKFEAPAYATNSSSGLHSGFNAFTFNSMLSIGKGFTENLYGFTYFGGAYRTGGYSSFVSAGGEVGYRFIEKIWVMFFIDVITSFENGDVSHDERQLRTGFYINNQEYTAWGMKFLVEITPNFGISSGFGGAFSGHMVAHSPAFSVGIYYKKD